MTSISVPKGGWDISLLMNFTGDNTTLLNYALTSISTTTNTLNSSIGFRNDSGNLNNVAWFNPGILPGLTIPPVRIAPTVSTTYYAVGQSQFSVAGANMCGMLRAVKVTN